MRNSKIERTLKKVIESLAYNEKLLDAVAEDVRKLSLLLFTTGCVGFFAQGEIIKITAEEARWLTIFSILMYLFHMTIITLNGEKDA
ncbi:hypothetical protein [Endozoicomonas sp. ALC066]|uniref:hypothetical protein n=1 Tax=Endozoicomonas sp. ALC066 TaxID=3403078 RepID=UPI003BB4B871